MATPKASKNNNELAPTDALKTAEVANLIGQLVARCDALDHPNLAFLLSIAHEEARHVAGLPALPRPSIFKSDTPPTLTL